MLITLVLVLACWRRCSCAGFTEAIGIAVVLVVVYLALNTWSWSGAVWQVVAQPGELVADWTSLLRTRTRQPAGDGRRCRCWCSRSSPSGLSGFETGVAVMPQVQGDPGDTRRDPPGASGTPAELLTTAALIMSVFLILSSLVTTVLIPQEEFEPGGEANGRALAYLAHEYLGERLRHRLRHQHHRHPVVRRGFGDGRPAQPGAALPAALRHGPGLGPGRAPTGAGVHGDRVLSSRSSFDADVDAQGGAYATGVLVLMTSAAVAVHIWPSGAARRGS